MSEALTAGDRPPAPPLRALRRLLPYVRPHRAALIGSGVAALAATLAGLAIPLVTRAIVDGPVAHGDLGGLPWLVLGVLAFGAVEAGLILLRRMLVAGAANQVEATMRSDLYAHLQRLPVAFHDRWASGQLLSRATSDLTTIRWFVMFSGIFLVVNALTVIVGVGVLVWLSPWLGLVIAVMAGPLTVTTLALERRYSRAARRAQDQVGDLATVVEESALGVRVLKSLGRGRRLTARFLADARGLRGTELTKVRLLAALWTVVVLVPEAAIAVILALGAYGVADGTLTLGTLVAAATVVTYLYWPVESLGWLLAEASNAGGRHHALLRGARHPARDHRPAATGATGRGAGRAGADGRPVPLSGRRPRHAARGGPRRAPGRDDGAGRRHRLGEDHAHGACPAAVRRDRRPGAHRRRRRPRRGAGPTAPGGGHRVRGPGADLGERPGERRLGVPGVPDDEIWAALRVASADGFVAALPWGLDTRIGEQGLSLSGGQRQRLALARAVLGRPPVLVLDDPLSALDVHTEAEVEAALRRVLGNVTALVVAHRPRPSSWPTGWRCCATASWRPSARTASCWRPTRTTGRCCRV